MRWLELDGVRGIAFRESVQERPDDIRRLEWQAYRTYAGSTQLITMILSTNSGDFSKHQDALYGVLVFDESCSLIWSAPAPSPVGRGLG